MKKRIDKSSKQKTSFNQLHNGLNALTVDSFTTLSMKLLKIKNINKLFQSFNKFFEKNLGSLHTGLFTIKDKKLLVFKAGNNWDIPLNTQLKISKRGIMGWVAKMKRELLIEDITGDERKLEENSGVRSIFAVPLLRGNDVLGIAVFGSKQPKKWTESDLMILRSLSTIIDAAISNTILSAEIKKYSERVKNQNQFIHSIINSFPSGIIIIDKKGNINLINKKAQEVFGLQTRGTSKISVKHLFDYKQATVNPLLKTITENKPLTRIETNIVEKDGKKTPLGFSTSPLRDESGRIIGAIAIMKELTEIKQREERSRRQDRLVALGEIAAGMAHEIRNPLAGIKTGVEYLGRFIDKKNSGAVNLIVNEINRLNRIVTDMTQYANRPPIKLENVNIQDIIDISLAFLNNEIEKKGIEIRKEFDERVPLLKLDSDQIREVFDNTILNAIQATKYNGKITISTILLGKEGRVEIRITDDGIGILKKDSERIFNPFFTTKRGGTGLGLSICHRIISEHNGYISISSKEGEGTTVKITLPINH